MSPTNAQSGDPGFTLTLTGIDFEATSVVRWNGADLVTTFISATQLQAAVPTANVADPGVVAISVFTPGPSGGLSTPETFFVLDASVSYFYDNFNRADNPDLGNGWTEKNPASFAIEDNEVTSIATPGLYYHDSIVTRPASEDLRDMEFASEFTISADGQFPQIHGRVERQYLGDVFTHGSYLFFINSFATPGEATIAIQPPVAAQMECHMMAIPFPSPLSMGDRVRLRFRVTGTNPVILTGIVERFVNGQWQVFVQGTTFHDNTTVWDGVLYCNPGDMPPPITTAGAIGFAKWETVSPAADNFYWMTMAQTIGVTDSQAPIDDNLLPFGNVDTFDNAVETVIVENIGMNDLTINSIGLSGPGAGQYAIVSACGSTLEQDQECDVTVTFSPTAAGLQEANLDISSDDVDVTVALRRVSVSPPRPQMTAAALPKATTP